MRNFYENRTSIPMFYGGMLVVMFAVALFFGFEPSWDNILPVCGAAYAAEGSPEPSAEKMRQVPKLKDEETAGSPQRIASMQLVGQARGQLERGRPDTAIRTLEKAVRIDAANGDAFILLSKAWKQKGEKRKALEFAKRAELLCHKQPAKLKEIRLLESELYHELGVSSQTRHKSHQNSSGDQRQSSE